MRAGDVMTGDVVSVGPEASILQAARLMLQNRISGLPVVDAEGRLVGMVSEGDFLRRGETDTQRRHPRWLEFLLGPGRLADEYVQACGRKVGEIMTTEVVSVGEDATLQDVVALMERHRIKRLPVVGDTGLIGMISRADLLRALVRSAHQPRSPAATDERIRADLLAELARHDWAAVNLLDIVVRDGNVDLRGTITEERARAAIRVAAENTAGVKAVHDHLVWLEPMSGLVVEPAAMTAEREA